MAVRTTPESEAFEILAVRVPRRLIGQIEAIAVREDENRSTIARRLLRRGLEDAGETRRPARRGTNG
jgi:N-acetylglutamate synthase-like GNAT family acetyltransferase